ncbi:Cu(I)-responsive transcriptional regulator [Vibrio sp. E150_011]
MNIGEVVNKTGLTAKSIRFYELKGLVNTSRSDNGYRTYDQTQLDILIMIASARRLGFSLDDCQDLVTFYQRRDLKSSEVKAKAESKIAEIESKIQDLTTMRDTLKLWVSQCPGNDSKECPIMSNLKAP